MKFENLISGRIINLINLSSDAFAKSVIKLNDLMIIH